MPSFSSLMVGTGTLPTSGKHRPSRMSRASIYHGRQDTSSSGRKLRQIIGEIGTDYSGRDRRLFIRTFTANPSNVQGDRTLRPSARICRYAECQSPRQREIRALISWPTLDS